MARIIRRGGLDRLGPQMVAAAVAAVNGAMSFALLHAKSDHRPGAHARGRFETQTGTLERGIRILSPARLAGLATVRGVWGVASVPYAHHVEFGGLRSRAFPYMRPAQREAGERLADFMRTAMRRRGLA